MKFAPKLTNLAYDELRSLIFNGIIRVLEDKHNYPFRTCVNCSHWISGNPLDKNGNPSGTANDMMSPPETCRLYKMRPPATVIVYGCSSYENDEIPF